MEFSQAFEPVAEKLQGWADSLVGLLPNLVVAILVILVAWVAAKLTRRLTERLADRAAARSAIQRLLGTLAFIAVVGVGLFVALGVLKLDKTVTSLLAGAGVLGLALGFAAQSIAANLLSGTVISLRRPYKEGDLIEAGDFFGTVERIELRVTCVKTPQGQLVLIPNKDMLENPLVNYSTLKPRRVDLEVGVSYDADLEQVRGIATEAIEGLEGRQPETGVELYYTEFGGSSINFVVRFWLPGERQADYMAARSDAVMRIKSAFDANDITIPFPIRTLDFGIEGGMTLSEALEPVSEARESGVG